MPIVRAIVVIVAFLLVANVEAALAQSKMFNQAPCILPPNAYCVHLTFDTSTTPVIRSYEITLPAKGQVQYSFNGTAYCILGVGSGNVVDFATQIVNDAAANPDPAGPGGNRHAAILASSANTFNLASTRVFNYRAGGAKTVFFRLEQLRVDPPIECFIYNAAFSAVYLK